MKSLILFCIIIGFFVGCNSKAFRAIQSVEKGFRLDSVVADKKAKEIAPCVTLSQDTTVKLDTIINIVYDTTEVVIDSLIALPCPDGSTVSTNIKYVTTTIRTTRTITNTYFITKTVEDKGKDIVIRDYQKELAKAHKKTNFWTAFAIISTMLFLVSIIILFIKKSLTNGK